MYNVSIAEIENQDISKSHTSLPPPNPFQKYKKSKERQNEMFS